MKSAAAGLGLVVLLASYLAIFVRRGWVPHDEGFLGQAAERALVGEVPHVHFQEAYTGALTYLHALAFAVLGTELVNLRWVLYVGAMLGVLCFFRIAVRTGRTTHILVITTLATAWSFPNYFAAIPSWWNLVLCAASLLALFRGIESRQLAPVGAAGLLCGVSFLLKQSALYVAIGCGLALLFAEQSERPAATLSWTRRGLWIRIATGGGALAVVFAILGPQLDVATSVYFLPAVIAVVVVLVIDAARRDLPPVRSTLRLLSTFGACAALPVSTFIAPYVVAGTTSAFISDWLGLSHRFAERVVMKPPDLIWLLFGVPVLLVTFVTTRQPGSRGVHLLWLAVVFGPLGFGNDTWYQMIWQSARLLSIVAPVMAAYVLWRWPDGPSPDRARLFSLAAVSALWMLVQFPFTAGVYFFYVAPITWLLLHALSGMYATRLLPLPLAMLYLLFAVVATNGAELRTLGWRHERIAHRTPLPGERSGLLVSEEDARLYGRLLAIITEHSRGRYIYAAPDCPEVYFLSASKNPTPTFFELLSTTTVSETIRAIDGAELNLVVINHLPQFSRPLGNELLSYLRTNFDRAECVGHFEVRWRGHDLGRMAGMPVVPKECHRSAVVRRPHP